MGLTMLATLPPDHGHFHMYVLQAYSFQQCDTDHDQVLSPAEFAKFFHDFLCLMVKKSTPAKRTCGNGHDLEAALPASLSLIPYRRSLTGHPCDSCGCPFQKDAKRW